MKIDEQTSSNLCIIVFYSCFREELILTQAKMRVYIQKYITKLVLL